MLYDVPLILHELDLNINLSLVLYRDPVKNAYTINTVVTQRTEENVYTVNYL